LAVKKKKQQPYRSTETEMEGSWSP